MEPHAETRLAHGERSDVNRDVLGLAGVNIATGLNGTFVVTDGTPRMHVSTQRRYASKPAIVVVVLTLLFGAVPHRHAGRTADHSVSRHPTEGCADLRGRLCWC
ncbi:hypothetical protein MIC448_1860004 [Microbacterium sp. C448]|nr:hypothetical protein MIC448_1860004 [Microbacterium sp. C448]